MPIASVRMVKLGDPIWHEDKPELGQGIVLDRVKTKLPGGRVVQACLMIRWPDGTEEPVSIRRVRKTAHGSKPASWSHKFHENRDKSR